MVLYRKLFFFFSSCNANVHVLMDVLPRVAIKADAMPKQWACTASTREQESSD